MSRCFPYIRTDQRREDRSKGPLLESIKKGRSKVANDNKKEKKREKEKSEKELRTKKRKYDERIQLKQDDSCDKDKQSDSIKQLEKSGLTEETGFPPSVPNPYYSSDSTQDSSKWRKIAPLDAGHNSSGGLVFRIKIPQQKRVNVVPPATDDRPCSSVRVEKAQATNKQILLTDRAMDRPLLQKHKTPGPPSTLTEQPSTSGRTLEPAAASAVEGKSGSRSKSRSRAEKLVMEFGELITNWLPPPVELDNQDDWLFGTKQQNEDCRTKRCSAIAGDVSDHQCNLSKARYLPEVDMVALPYVIPY